MKGSHKTDIDTMSMSSDYSSSRRSMGRGRQGRGGRGRVPMGGRSGRGGGRFPGGRGPMGRAPGRGRNGQRPGYRQMNGITEVPIPDLPPVMGDEQSNVSTKPVSTNHPAQKRKSATAETRKKKQKGKKKKAAAPSDNNARNETKNVATTKKKKNKKQVNKGKKKNKKKDNEPQDDSSSSESESSSNDDDIPDEWDVCFGAEEHPGTDTFLKVLRDSLEQFGPVAYTPKVYRRIKKQVPSSRFFVCDDDDNPYDWREVTKSELVDLVWKYYEEEKEHFN